MTGRDFVAANRELFFTLSSDSAEIRAEYERSGYVIFKEMIPTPLIHEVRTALASLSRSKLSLYYSQSIHRWIRPRISSAGFMIDSMENPSWHMHLPHLRRATMNVIYHSRVTDALQLISGHTKFCSWQDMLFDRSTGTIDHQDSWYLDTKPEGKLIGAWFALEDIHQDSGPFFVYPGSHKLPRVSEDEYPDHNDFIGKIMELRRESNLAKRHMDLPVGSVLFWHPNLIHGADFPADEQRSRKSLTSHYYPLGYLRKDSVSLDHDAKMMKPTNNERMFRKGVPEAAFVVKGYVKFLRDKVLGRNQPILPMGRDAYQ
jgi:phytanoyl-CoA hydroxylase